MTEGPILAIDGGATRSRGRVVGRDGRVLAEAEGGAANIHVDPEGAAASILGLTDALVARAGLAGPAELRAGLGLAGAGQAADRARFAEVFASPFASAFLATDAEAACLGAHGGGEGGVIIVGTGSCAVLMRQGRSVQIGGWGFPVSDGGSGAVMGLSAVRHALEAADGLVEGGPLAAMVLEQVGGSPEAAVGWAAGARSRDYAALAPSVLAAEGLGDRAARRILAEAAAAVTGFLDRLTALGAPRICLLGGALAEALSRRLPPAAASRLASPLGDAQDGAAWLTRKGWGEPLPPRGA